MFIKVSFAEVKSVVNKVDVSKKSNSRLLIKQQPYLLISLGICNPYLKMTSR